MAAAEQAAFAALEYVSEYWPIDDDEHLVAIAMCGYGDGGSRATNSMAALIRNIGRDRATAPVLGQQLKIDGVLANGELTPVQTLIAKVFAATIAEIEAFDAAELERNQPDSEPEERAPVPIEDTTLEAVDDPMATWGGR